jgi:hypothetical protein
MEFFNKIINVKEKFEEKFKSHHELYPSIRIKSVHWEHIFQDVASELDIVKDVIWDSKSHRSGTDIEFYFNDGESKNISMKSGEIKGDFLKVSSFRTSQFKTINEKVNHSVKTMSEEDYVIFLTYDDFNKEYNVFTIDSKVLVNKLKSLEWNKIENKNGNNKFVGERKDFNAAFIESMSGQLWYSIHLKHLKKLFSIKIS